jgi:hypothetical protein
MAAGLRASTDEQRVPTRRLAQRAQSSAISEKKQAGAGAGLSLRKATAAVRIDS